MKHSICIFIQKYINSKNKIATYMIATQSHYSQLPMISF